MPASLRRPPGRVGSGLRHFMLLGFLLGVAALPAMLIAQEQGQPMTPQGDPPSVVARISVAMGDVSVEPASVDQFSAAEVNDALTTGDRLYADVGSNAELQTGELAVRVGQQTDLTVTAMTNALEQFGLAQGSVHLRSFALEPGTTVELDTPNVAVTLLQRGDVRVDVDPDAGTTTVTLVAGQAQVDGEGFQEVLEGGQRVRLEGSNPVSAQWLDMAEPDGLDGFSSDRDDAYESAMQSEEDYVNPAMIGAEDLSANGDWEAGSGEGPVWYPSGVAVGWTPYSVGRWGWVAPWGWTWVERERWGFAPFHYGRWEHRGNRWGWIPGPPVVRPIYAPAMVAFVGRPGLMAGGGGVTAWFPLGPRETYVPWYHASPVYMNRVNVSNVYSRHPAEVLAIYNQPTVAGAYAAGQRGYVNRPLATVAVSQASFAAGRPVAQSMARVSAGALASAPVLPHPLVTPQRMMVVPTMARAVPVHAARPTLASRASEAAAGRPGLQMDPRPGSAMGSRPDPRPGSGMGSRTGSLPGSEMGGRQGGGGSSVGQPGAPGMMRSAGPELQVVPARRSAPESRALFHEAVPPEPRPSFEQQQRAIETIDPGRPLGPQQMENLRQNRPAGPPQQRETQHAAPAPRAAPAMRSAPAQSMPRR